MIVQFLYIYLHMPTSRLVVDTVDSCTPSFSSFHNIAGGDNDQ